MLLIDTGHQCLAAEVPLPATETKQSQLLLLEGHIMLLTLFCLARTFLPCAAAWAAEMETQAAIMAFVTFAFLLYRLGLESSHAPSPGSHLENSGRIQEA
jgi:hypothetical protein